MKLLSIIIAFVVAVYNLTAQVEQQNDQDQLNLLREILAARDRSINRLYVEFTWKMPGYEYKCTNALKDNIRALKAIGHKITNGKLIWRETSHIVYDKSEWTHFTHYKDKQPFITIASRDSGLPLLGLFRFETKIYYEEGIEELFRRPDAQIKVVGYENIGNFNCMRVQIIYNPFPDIVNAYELWIDINKALVIKRISFSRNLDNKSVPSDWPILRFQQYDLVIDSEDYIEEAVQLSGIWFPVKGIIRCYDGVDLPERGDKKYEIRIITQTVNTETLKINEPFDESIFEIVPPEDCVIHDTIQNKIWYIGPSGNKISRMEYRFEKLLEKLKKIGFNPSEPPKQPQQFHLATCAHTSLYLYLRASSYQVSLSELLERLPNTDKGVSLEQIANVANSYTQLQFTRIPREKWSALDSIMMLWYVFNPPVKSVEEHEKEGHFVVSIAKEGKFKIILPPYESDWLSTEEVEKFWEGYALVPVDKQIGAVPSKTTSYETKSFNLLWLVPVVLLLLMGFAIFFVFRKKKLT